MAYNQQLVIDKLRKLTGLQDSIQLTSNWVIYHRRNFRETVAIWFRELTLAPTNNALNLMYLANDVLQNSRKRSPEFIDEFSKYLPDSYSYLFGVAPPDIKRRLERLVDIWETRSIFSNDYCNRLREFARAADPLAFQSPSSTSILPSSSQLLSSSRSSLPLPSFNNSISSFSSPSLLRLIEESQLIRANAQQVKDFLALPVRPHNDQFRESFQSASKILDSLLDRQVNYLNSLQMELAKENEALQQYQFFKKQFQERVDELGPTFLSSLPATTTTTTTLTTSSSTSSIGRPPSPSAPLYPSLSSSLPHDSRASPLVGEPLPPAQLELLSTLLNTPSITTSTASTTPPPPSYSPSSSSSSSSS